jgi:tripartite-type tricarboxylate transporter receptor subunit TctC
LPLSQTAIDRRAEEQTIMSVSAKILCATIGLVFSAQTALAQSVEDFYKGKSIQIIVGFGAGGGYDLYARALGRHLGKYVPGSPAVVVQNMAGAGSIQAANYVYGGSPKDGTVIAAVNQNAAMYQLLGGAGARFEAAQLQWLGSMTNSNGTVYTWHTSGIKTLDDAKKREVPMGAVGAQSDSVIFPNLINELLGTKFKPITGYTGSTQIHLAMERGEVMGRGGNSWSSLRTANAGWLKENKINMLVQVGFKKEPELPQVPLLLDLVKDEEGKSVVRVISLPTAIGYGHWLAPEVPKDRLAALRTAYAAVMKDPEFLKEAEKTRMDIRFQTGDEVEALIKQVIKTPKAVLNRTAQILKWK